MSKSYLTFKTFASGWTLLHIPVPWADIRQKTVFSMFLPTQTQKRAFLDYRVIWENSKFFWYHKHVRTAWNTFTKPHVPALGGSIPRRQVSLGAFGSPDTWWACPSFLYSNFLQIFLKLLFSCGWPCWQVPRNITDVIVLYSQAITQNIGVSLFWTLCCLLWNFTSFG